MAPCARRAAPVPASCSSSAAETEELLQLRIQRRLIPPPDPQNFGIIRTTSPETLDILVDATRSNSLPATRRLRTPSPTSSYRSSVNISAMPPAIARDPRRKTTWLKARAQYARDRELQRYPQYETEYQAQRVGSGDPGPKRKQPVFVKEEELKCFHEDRVGTPHISELQADLEVVPPLGVEELGLGGAAEELLDISGVREHEVSEV